jgi:hypothetical protein
MRYLVHLVGGVAICVGLVLGWWAHGAFAPGPATCPLGGAKPAAAGTAVRVAPDGVAYGVQDTVPGSRVAVCSGGRWVFVGSWPSS